MNSDLNQLKKGEQLAKKALWLEGALVIGKVSIGWLSGSLALISDAIHSASDIVSIVTSWLGLKIAQKKADEKFPYGYYKSESLGSLLISLLILWAFWQMLKQGYGRLFSLSNINIPVLALIISLADAIILFFFGQLEIKVGQEINARSLVAMGKENRTHLFSSLAVFMGTLAAYLQVPYIEGLVTMGISFLILKIALEEIKEAVLNLMDISPGQKITDQVIKLIESLPGIEQVLDLKLRKAGPVIFGQTQVGIRKFTDVKQSQQIAEKVEQEIKNQLPNIKSFTVKVIPFKSDWQHLVLPANSQKGLKTGLAKTFSRAPYLLFINLKNNQIKGSYTLKNPYKNEQSKAGLKTAQLLIKQKSDTLITAQIGEIAFYVLKESLFDIYQTQDKQIKTVLDKFNSNQLNRLESPTRKV